MSGPAALPTALPAVLAVALAGCASTPLDDPVARAANEEAIAKPLPEGAAVVVVEDGKARAADELDAAFDLPSEALSRFVFRPSEEGDRAFTVAYLPQSGIVAGDAFLEALGAELRSDARRQLSLRRAGRSVQATSDRTVAVTLSGPGETGGSGQSIRVTLDPDARGALLMPRTLALRLGAARGAIPGTTYVDVALGRPFEAHRAHLRAAIADLDIETLVEVVYAAPPPEAQR